MRQTHAYVKAAGYVGRAGQVKVVEF